MSTEETKETEEVLELDTSTVKSNINDIIECSGSVAKIIRDTMRTEEASEENMELIIQEIVNEYKFVELTNKFNDTKNRQLANIAAQDKEARTVQTIRHKEQMKKEVAKLKKRIKELEKPPPPPPPPTSSSSPSSSTSSSSSVERPRKIAKKAQPKKTGEDLISSRTRTRSNVEEEEDGNVSEDY
jgi:hypothetical protein